MKDLITVQKDSRDTNNPQPVYTGTPRYTKVPCTINAVSGTETFRGRQLKAETTHVVDLQFLPEIETDDLLSVTGGWKNGSTLHIIAVTPIERPGKSMKLELHCRELVS